MRGAPALACALASLAACATAPKQSGFELLMAGDPVAAEEAFRTAMRLSAQDDRARDGLGAALAAQERHQEGCPLLAVDSSPLSSYDCWLQAMLGAEVQGQWAQMVAIAKRVKADRWPAEARRQMLELSTSAARQTADWDLLLKLYPQQLAFDPTDAQLHYQYGRALEARQYVDDALREYELAASLAPGDEDIHRTLSRLQARIAHGATRSAARVEAVDQATLRQARGNEVGDGVQIQSWGSGSVHASIAIEGMSAATATTSTVPLTIDKAHWPSGVDEAAVRGRIGAWVERLECRDLLVPGTVRVTWGPEGTVEQLALDNVPASVETCLRRQIRGWILRELRGGYLRLSFPYPPPTPAPAAAPAGGDAAR